MRKYLAKTKKMSFLIFLLLFVAGTLSVQAQEADFFDPFDDPELSGWDRSPGATASDGVLHIESGNFAFHPGNWGEMEIHVMMRFEGEGEAVFIYQMGSGSAYQIIFQPDYMVLFRDVEGGSIVLGSAELAPTRLEDWFHLTVLSAGNNQIVLVNDELIFEAQATDPLPPGGIGFEVHGGMNLEVDEVTIFSLGEGPPPEEEPPSGEEPAPTEAAETIPEPPPQPTGEFAWVRTGGPLGGIGYDIRYKFDQPTTWYVTDNFAGVHISTDDGLTWQPSNQGIPGQLGPTGDWKPVFSLTVDPNNSDILWAGTDATGHIYKSTDGGQTWVQKDNGIQQMTPVYNALTFRGFTVDPDDSNVVYAMSEIKDLLKIDQGGVWGTGIGGQVYKTVDGGENWSLLWDGGIPSSLARYLWINPEDTGILYVSTGIFDRGAVGEGKETDPNPYGGLGILKSTDGGKTWRVLNKENGLNFLYVGSLFMHPDDPEILLAATGKVTSDEYIEYLKENGLASPMGVYRTTDGGETWTQVLGNAGFDVVEICTVDTNIAYAGNASEVYRSEDAGITWALVSGSVNTGWGPPGVLAGTPIDFQCDPEDPDRLFSNNYVGGNFLSEDGGKTWALASDGYTGAQTLTVKVDSSNPAQIYAAGRNGIWGSHDGGSTWYGMRYPPEGERVWAGEWGGISIDPGDSEHLLATEETIWESFDGGKSWEVRRLPAHGQGAAIVFAPSDPNTVYTGGLDPLCVLHSEASCRPVFGLYVSHDGGSTWDFANDDNIASLAIIDIAVDKLDADTVYIGTMDGLYKTTDGGKTWMLNAGLPAGERVSVITIHPEDDNTLLAGVDTFGLYASADGGNSWQQAAAGLLPNPVIRDVLFDPVNPQTVYLTDVSSGVYHSVDGGNTWTAINNGLTNRAAVGLGISADGLHLYAATNGEGVFRLDLTGEPPGSLTPAEEETPPPSEEEEPPGEEPQQQSTESPGTEGPGPDLLLGIAIGAGAVLLAGAVFLTLARRRKD